MRHKIYLEAKQPKKYLNSKILNEYKLILMNLTLRKVKRNFENFFMAKESFVVVVMSCVS